MARNSSGKTILLIYDGHKSYETIELHETVVQHKIQLYCLPAHTSHRLWPLDVGVFGPLQHAWQNCCAAAMEDTGQEVTWQQVVKEYMAACTKSFKETTILSAWRKSRILPFDPKRFMAHNFGPSIPSSFKVPLPSSFLMPPTCPELPSDDDISVEGFSDLDTERGNEESNDDEGNMDKEGVCVDHLNQDIRNEFPFLAELITINQSPPPSPPHYLHTPPCLSMPQHNCVYLMKREESPEGALKEIPLVVWNCCPLCLLLLTTTPSAPRPMPSKFQSLYHIFPKQTLLSLWMNDLQPLRRGLKSLNMRWRNLGPTVSYLEAPSNISRSKSIPRRTRRRLQPVQRRPLGRQGF
jgi:hypothetical protein